MGASVETIEKLKHWDPCKRCTLCNTPMPVKAPEPCYNCVSRYGEERANLKFEEKILVRL
jgi:hypothetical protein